MTPRARGAECLRQHREVITPPEARCASDACRLFEPVGHLQKRRLTPSPPEERQSDREARDKPCGYRDVWTAAWAAGLELPPPK